MNSIQPSLSDGYVSTSTLTDLHHAGYSLILFDRYCELTSLFHDWKELAISSLSLPELLGLEAEARRRVGILTGFASGRIYLHAENREVRRWITSKFNPVAHWNPYIFDGVQGFLTSFRHAGSAVVEEVYGVRPAGGAAGALAPMTGRPGDPEGKPNIIAILNNQPDLFSIIESGCRVIDCFGAVQVFGESDFLPLADGFDPRSIETGVIYRSDWLAFNRNGGWRK